MAGCRAGYIKQLIGHIALMSLNRRRDYVVCIGAYSLTRQRLNYFTSYRQSRCPILRDARHEWVKQIKWHTQHYLVICHLLYI